MKIKYLCYILAAIALIAVSCGSNEDKKAPVPTTAAVEDSAEDFEMIDTVLSAENIDTFSTMAFSSYAKKQVNSFDWSRFRMEHTWTDDALLVTNYTPDKKFYEAYGRYLKYSPDSTYFIDLDSYNVDIRKDSKGKWQGTEAGPDSEVSLVNLKTKKKTRLLFLGPGNSIEDALWLDKENLAIMGIEDYDSLGKAAAVWKFNIPTNTYFQYELKDSLAARQLMGYWRKERLKGIMVN